ncbi:alkaline phosphatase D family protein [Micromonospora andamanensis]|uniref:alkaline phosphatase D family protein n=1 Tax=Micromonospora andamanensis TaxID=1287068 RepID=UPI00194EB252|nr:alkaline phosphatase D family protein [Micromonospora andamanensis]
MSNLWVGAVTESSAWVRGRVSSSANARLVVSESPSLTSPAYFGPVAPTSELVASIEADGLDPDTQYHYAFEHDSVVDTAWQGSFRTHPVLGEPASYAFAMATCAGSINNTASGGYTDSKVSNHPVFDVIRQHVLDPLFFIHGGDLHYRDIATNTPASYRTAYDDVLTYNGTLGATARQGLLYRNRPLVLTWDDHCYATNDSDATATGRPAARQVYRERVPHYPLAESGAIYHSFGAGRVLYIVSDARSESSPGTDTDGPSKTMLGSAQKSWMESVLSAPGFDAQYLVWVMSRQWMGSGVDTWSVFGTERDELVQLFGDTGWLSRMCQVSGDVHALGMDTGTGNSWGGFPVYCFSSLDSTPSGGTSQYDLGQTQGGRGQYGTVQIHDIGSQLAVTGTGWVMDQPWRWHTSTLPLARLTRRHQPPASHVLPL